MGVLAILDIIQKNNGIVNARAKEEKAKGGGGDGYVWGRSFLSVGVGG